MARINLLNEILKWSLNRPFWQRDALRRLITRIQIIVQIVGWRMY